MVQHLASSSTGEDPSNSTCPPLLLLDIAGWLELRPVSLPYRCLEHSAQNPKRCPDTSKTCECDECNDFTLNPALPCPVAAISYQRNRR
jgi:hypothetical protein